MICEKCGKESGEGKFCRYCGSALNVPSAESPSVEAQNLNREENMKIGKLKCPRCGSRKLQAVTETDTNVTTSGGGYSAGKGCLGWLVFGPLGLLCGACGSKQKTTVQQSNKSYWVCPDCGNKFRDTDELWSEIESQKQSMKQINILFIAGICLCLFLVILGSSLHISFFTAFGWIFLIICAVFLLVNIIVTPKKIQQSEAEYDELVRASRE